MKHFAAFLTALAVCSAAATAQDNGNAGEQFRGFRLSPGIGVLAPAPSGLTHSAFELGLGNDTSDQIYLGGGLQLTLPFDSDHLYPFLGAFMEQRVYFPNSPTVSLMLRNRFHVRLDTDHENVYAGLSFLPGVMMKLSPKVDMSLCAGYQFDLNLDSGGALHGFAFRTTFDFHRASGIASKSSRPYHPSGLEIGFSLGMGIQQDYYNDSSYYDEDNKPEVFPVGVLSLGYRFNPKMSAAAELLMGPRYMHAKEDDRHYGPAVSEDVALMLSGRYRFSDKDFAPMVMLRGGFTRAEFSSYHDENSTYALLLSPRGGVSWRLGSGNGHLELTAGPGIGLTLPHQVSGASKKHIFSMFRPEVSIHYYHTLGIGSNWFKE